MGTSNLVGMISGRLGNIVPAKERARSPLPDGRVDFWPVLLGDTISNPLLRELKGTASHCLVNVGDGELAALSFVAVDCCMQMSGM
jgi:hypothetical protein